MNMRHQKIIKKIVFYCFGNSLFDLLSIFLFVSGNGDQMIENLMKLKTKEICININDQSDPVECGMGNTCTFSHIAAWSTPKFACRYPPLSVGRRVCAHICLLSRRWGRRVGWGQSPGGDVFVPQTLISIFSIRSQRARDAKRKRWITSRLLLLVFGSRARHKQSQKGGAKYLHRRAFW